MNNMALKKLMIVIEETGEQNDKEFVIHLEGDTGNLKNGTPENKLSAAEFWGMRLFWLCATTVQKTSAFDTAYRKH
jgi:hypothetical protein